MSNQPAYKDNGDWKSVQGFTQGDLLNVAKCAERAELWITRQRAEAH